jgi:TetR/AcrR family transcriptional regulator
MPGETDLSRREREQLQHKQLIVDVAMRLFSVRGFHTVSMQEIAAEAEFAIGTLYKFFPSKEALYEEIMAQSGRRILEILGPILDAEMDEREKLAKTIRASIGIYRLNAPVIRLFLETHQQCLVSDPTLLDDSSEKAKFHRTIVTKFEEVIASGIRKGFFRNIDPRVGALTINATLRSLVFAAAQESQTDLLERRIADFEQLLLNGLLNSPR